VKLFSHNSNLYDHDTSTSQTDGQLALAFMQPSARLRTVKIEIKHVFLRPR